MVLELAVGSNGAGTLAKRSSIATEISGRMVNKECRAWCSFSGMKRGSL